MGYYSIILLACIVSVVPLFFISIKTHRNAIIISFVEAVIVISVSHLYFIWDNIDQDPFYYIAIFVVFLISIIVSLFINLMYLFAKSYMK
jgi:hypothetical protein